MLFSDIDLIFHKLFVIFRGSRNGPDSGPGGRTAGRPDIAQFPDIIIARSRRPWPTIVIAIAIDYFYGELPFSTAVIIISDDAINSTLVYRNNMTSILVYLLICKHTASAFKYTLQTEVIISTI